MSKAKLAVLILVPLLLLYGSLYVGRFSVEPLAVLRILLSRFFPLTRDWSAAAETIVVQVRFPRAVMAMCVGAGLSISGAAYQGMFRNPLVSTDILGVSAASGFGAALAILLSASALDMQVMAFAFGLGAVALTYTLASVYRTTPVLMLVLAGVVVAAFFTALLCAVKYVADPDSKLPAVTYWLLGSFGSATLGSLAMVVPLIAVGIVGLLSVRWKLNVLAMGDEEARSLGIRTELLKGLVIVCTTLITAAAVAVSGIIGWVGLLVPHVARMMVGPDNQVLLPATLAIGASYLLVIDDIARTATSGEIPLGILTAAIGAPYFAYLLRRTKGRWQ